MVYTERAVLLNPGKIQSNRKKWIGLLLGVTLVSLVAVLCIVQFNSSKEDSSSPSISLTATGNNENDEIPDTIGSLSASASLTSSENNEKDWKVQRSTNPIVKTPLGKVEGLTLTSRAGREYNAFYNLPYAQPPIGNLRFRSPIPAVPWTGTRNGTVKGSMCVQKTGLKVEGNEDCLQVGLCTPKLPSRRQKRTELMPVITYFFGGIFMFGTGTIYGCDYFMDEDVVIVMVDSRVGALGFLNTGDMEARGNMGLKDQTMALRWIQENIAAFGGDPKRVVAFGTSSGGMSAHALLLSPMNKGLFSGIISGSGNMFVPGFFSTDPAPAAKKIATALNCNTKNGTEVMMKCLREVPAWEIALAQPPLGLGPSLEPIPSNGDMSDVFFSDSPVALASSGQVNNVPWLTGCNSAETILLSYGLLLPEQYTHLLNDHWKRVLPLALFLSSSNQTEVDEVTRQVYDFYFENKTISRTSDTRFNLTDVSSDRAFIHPTKTAGLAHAQNNNVYLYYLTKEANKSWSQIVNQFYDPPYGVSHVDELQYFFTIPQYPYIPLDSPWGNFSVQLVKFWVSFASTGAPMNPDPNGVPWPAIDLKDDGMIWYNLDDKPKLIEPFTERMRLWDSFPFDLLYNP